MRIDIVTIFPNFFDSPLKESIIRRAADGGILDIRIHDLRRWTEDRHRMTDDYPYGGGGGDGHEARTDIRRRRGSPVAQP